MFEVLYHPDVVDEDFGSVDRRALRRIKTAIENRLRRAPCDYGKPLRGGLKSLWRLRVGDHRVVYLLRGKTVVILRIADRKDAYSEGVAEARRRGLI